MLENKPLHQTLLVLSFLGVLPAYQSSLHKVLLVSVFESLRRDLLHSQHLLNPKLVMQKYYIEILALSVHLLSNFYDPAAV